MSQTKSSRFRAPAPTASARMGHGEPLLLIHPFTTSHHVWSDVMPELAREYDVVAATLPGHWGGPEIARGAVSFDAYADGVETLMDDLGWETAHIAGNSIGGWLSLEMARRGRARSVTAIAPAGGWTRFSRNQIVVGTKFLGLYALALTGHVLGDVVSTLPALRPLVLKLVSKQTRAVAVERSIDFVRASSNCSSFLPFIVSELRGGRIVDVAGLDAEVPVRLVLCEHDVLLPPKAYGAPYERAMPDADVVMLAGVGHIPMFENPGLVSETILEHVRACSDASRGAATA